MNTLEKDFIPYEPSLALKELGFDEPCICGYSKSNEKLEIYSRFLVTKDSFTVDAPTFSQAFRFFREKYDMPCNLELLEDGWDYVIYMDIEEEIDLGEGPFTTYEEAELACLIKLIEIVKNK